MFGEGRHPHIQRLYETRLAPFLTQTSLTFWKTRLHYFRNGLYYQGGMVRDPSQSILIHIAVNLCVQKDSLIRRIHLRALRSCWQSPIRASCSGSTSTNNTVKTCHCSLAPQGQVVWMFQIIMRCLGLGGAVLRVATAPTLEDQRAAWEAAWPVRLLRSGPAWLVNALISLVSLLFFNRFVLWCVFTGILWLF